jgi:flagellar assembly factor FliW
MQINSRLFGEIDIQDDKLIVFEHGIMGFENLRKFALIFDSDKEGKNKIMWLQSMEEAGLAIEISAPTPEAPSVAKALELYLSKN